VGQPESEQGGRLQIIHIHSMGSQYLTDLKLIHYSYSTFRIDQYLTKSARGSIGCTAVCRAARMQFSLE